MTSNEGDCIYPDELCKTLCSNEKEFERGSVVYP